MLTLMIKGNRDKPVPTEADALLAKVSALKDARGEGDEAGGIEPHFHDSRGGGSQRQDEEAWSDHTSNTLDQTERKLMALKANKEGKEEREERGSMETATIVGNSATA